MTDVCELVNKAVVFSGSSWIGADPREACVAHSSGYRRISQGLWLVLYKVKAERKVRKFRFGQTSQHLWNFFVKIWWFQVSGGCCICKEQRLYGRGTLMVQWNLQERTSVLLRCRALQNRKAERWMRIEDVKLFRVGKLNRFFVEIWLFQVTEKLLYLHRAEIL